MSPTAATTTPDRPDAISFVIPARNEAAAIARVVSACLALARARAVHAEVIVVDDASTDDTAACVAVLARADDGIRLLRHDTQQGIARTSHAGLLAAHHPIICYLDGDGQFDAADFAPLLDRLDAADFVVGHRVVRTERGARTWGSLFYNRCTRAAGVPLHDVNCGFRVMTRTVLTRALPRVQSRSSFYFAELTLRVLEAGGRVAEVPIPHHPRQGGTPSGASPRVVVVQFLDLARHVGRRGRRPRVARDHRA